MRPRTRNIYAKKERKKKVRAYARDRSGRVRLVALSEWNAGEIH